MRWLLCIDCEISRYTLNERIYIIYIERLFLVDLSVPYGIYTNHPNKQQLQLQNAKCKMQNTERGNIGENKLDRLRSPTTSDLLVLASC